MKILFKHPNILNTNNRLNIDLDLSILVGEIRIRISKILDISLSMFQLVTKTNNIVVLLTDSWPLSFFITEDNPKIKVKLLDLPGFTRRESNINSCLPFWHNSVINYPFSLKPLDFAILECKSGNLENLKALIKNDENNDDSLIHQVQESQWGLIHYACLSGCSEIVAFLVSEKVNCNKVTIDEWTPLQLSCHFGHLNCVVELLRHPNIQINKKTKFRGTGLHIACELGQIEILKILLEKHPALHIEDHRHKTPIELVKFSEIFEILAVYAGERQLKKYENQDFQVPFCSEVYLINIFSLSDKLVFLYMDVEKGTINRYANKGDFLDKKPCLQTMRLIDVQYVASDKKSPGHYSFVIETSTNTMKYYTKYKELTNE